MIILALLHIDINMKNLVSNHTSDDYLWKIIIPTSDSDKVMALATAETTFSAGIIAAKSNCSETVSTVAVII